MRTIPPNMLAAFREQQGLSPKYIVEINWHDEETIMYSTCEFQDLEVYAYVKEFGEFESVSHVEGLGAVSSMQIVFYDQFGHFKEKIDTVDFFAHTTATVYMTLDGTELYDLFEGKISDNAEWVENEFTIEVLSENIKKEVGYQPSIDDVDEEDPNYAAFERRLNTNSAWPSIFGTVKNYEIPIIWKQREAVTTEDVSYEPGGTPPYYELKIEDHEDFTLDSEYFVNIIGRANSVFSILGTGEFTNNEDDEPVFRLNKTGITSNWYRNIAFTVLDDGGITGETDQPATRLELAPGPLLIDEVELHTLGPDGEETEFVWLQFMKLEVRYSNDLIGGGTYHVSKYVNCVKQQGNIVTLNEKLEIAEGSYDIYIRNVTKANDIIYQIPSGSKIFIMGDRIAYAVDTKTETVIDKITVKYGEKHETIDPSVYEVKTDPLWMGEHSEVKYIHMLGEIYMRYVEHYALKDDVHDGLLCSAHNSFNTEASAIQELTGLTTIDTAPNNVNFAYTSVEDAEDVVPEIAWQANKAVRYTRQNNDDVLELIDLTNTTDPPVFEFNEDNVLRDSIKYGYSSSDDLYTVFKADFQTNDHEKDLKVIRLKKNVDLYEENVLDTDYYIFRSKAVAKEKFSWWRDKLSRYYHVVRLTGFMDAFGLEVWDRVSVNLDTTNFYDPTLGTPFTHTHTAEPETWVGTGRIKEIRPDLEKGLIEFTIEIEDF